MKEILKTVWAFFYSTSHYNIMQYFAYISGLIKKECNG